MQENTKKISVKAELFDWIWCVLVALVASILIFTFLGRVMSIIGPSMRNTLHNGDRVLVSNLFFTPEQGDVVIVTKKSFSEDSIVKRVIAVEGQEIDMDFETGQVWVDGQLLDEPYIREQMWRHYDMRFPQVVPEGHIFVMGDNRNESTDSRNSAIGMVDTRCVLGKVYYIIAPFDRFGKVN